MEDQLLHVCTYVCAKCCYPQKIKTLLTYLLTKSESQDPYAQNCK